VPPRRTVRTRGGIGDAVEVRHCGGMFGSRYGLEFKLGVELEPAVCNDEMTSAESVSRCAYPSEDSRRARYKPLLVPVGQE
jgi:hypothetical protein